MKVVTIIVVTIIHDCGRVKGQPFFIDVLSLFG